MEPGAIKIACRKYEIWGKYLEVKTPNQGFTPLHAACAHGNIEYVKVLIEVGADIKSKTNKGYTALDLAKENGHSKVIEYLEQEKMNKVDLLKNCFLVEVFTF